MQTSSTPLVVAIDPESTVTDLVRERLDRAPDHVAFEVPTPGGSVTDPWRPITTSAFARDVTSLARGLIAAGLQIGDRVAILAATQYDWAVADLASWWAGAVVVPVYESSSLDQIVTILRDADVSVLFAGTNELARLAERAFAEVERDGRVWTFEARSGADLTALRALGPDVDDDTLERHRSARDADSVATIVYTSGTSGAPKGALITHRNLLSQVRNIAVAYGDVVRDDGNTVIFLPLAHVLARGLQLICLANGMRIAHISQPKDAVVALAVLRPTFLVVVPRILQKIQGAAAAKAAEKGLSRVWRSAQRTAIEWGRHLESIEAGHPARASLALRINHAVFDRLFFGRLRGVMGGRIEYLLSGAASLDPELGLFFRGIGVPVIEGYGLTETTAPLTGNLPGNIRAGTVGVPLPGLEVAIADDGEVLARGAGVFAGYKDAAQDADAFVDGYFRTGDLGRLDPDGRLILQGRLKDVIVTAGGKTVVPADWERVVEQHPLVAHVVTAGEGRPYLTAFVVVDAEALDEWASSRDGGATDGGRSGTDDFVPVDRSDLIAELTGQAQHANRQVSHPEQVQRILVLRAAVGAPGSLVTPTLKLKRGAFLEHVAPLLDDLYAGRQGHAVSAAATSEGSR